MQLLKNCTRCPSSKGSERKRMAMAAHSGDVTVTNVEFWLNKAVEWGQADNLESRQDVCLHLPNLHTFLLQIHEILKHTNFIVAIKRFPLLGQLLGRLCWNPLVVASDESRRALVWCLCCLHSSEPQSPVQLRANKWIKNLLCHLFSFLGTGSNEECSFLQTLGCTPGNYYSQLLKNMVSSLVSELRANQLNGFNIQGSVTADRVKNMSVLCVPLMSMTDVTPLLEILLVYHDSGSKEILSLPFLEAVNEALIQKKIVLSEPAVLGLWLRHLPSLEAAALHLFESLISNHRRSLKEMEHIIEDSLLPRAACHPSVFGILEEFFKHALLDTDGSSEVLTIIRLFTRCFVRAHREAEGQKIQLKAYFRQSIPSLVVALLQNPSDLPSTVWCQHLKCVTDVLKFEVDDATARSPSSVFDLWFLLIHFGDWIDVAVELLMTSVADALGELLWLLTFYYIPDSGQGRRTQTVLEVRTVADRLKNIYKRTNLSVAVLQDAFSLSTNSCCPGKNLLLKHLTISFLLHSAGGPMIAKEYVAEMTQTHVPAREVSDILAHVEHRLNIPGVQNQRTMALARELLWEIQTGTKDV